MAFDFCCFISYPHGQKNVLVPIIENFVEALGNEIYAEMTGKEIFVDQEFLKGGEWLDETIGPSICKSACMILFYTPLYFDANHIYCARELKAMELLEKQRMDLLNDRGKGLIISIILRGPKKFPEALKNRMYHDFSDIAFNASRNSIRARYAEEIKEIAQYIIERCERLDTINELSHDCDDHSLPDEEEAKDFVEIVLGKKIVEAAVDFPNRTETSANVQG